MRDAIALDQPEILFGVELLHDDQSAAKAQRSRDANTRRGMIERRRQEIGHAFAEAPGIVKGLSQRPNVIRRIQWHWPKNAFGMAGRPRGIEHWDALAFVGDGRRGKLRSRLV